MPNKIKLKQSGVAGKVPALTDLDVGELLFNYADGILYCKRSFQGLETIVPLAASEAPHLFRNIALPAPPPTEYIQLFAKGDELYSMDAAGNIITLSPGAHNHDDKYLRLDGGQMSTTDIVKNLNAQFLDGNQVSDFAPANHSHPASSLQFSKIELSNSPAQIAVNSWTAIPGMSLTITDSGNYLISAQVGLQRSATAGYVAARIKVGSTIIASAEEFGSNRAAFNLSSIKQVTIQSVVTIDIWSNITGTSAISATPTSLSGSATILSFLKI